MSHPDFQVKVSDMLKAKVTDQVSFENKILEEIPNLSAEGVSGEISLQSIGKDSIFATIDNLSCMVSEICDRCGTEYQREINISDYTAKYVLNLTEDEQKEEEVMQIDSKNGVIDLGEFVYHAIKMQDPFVKYCPSCEKYLEENPQEDELDEYESFVE
jgi:hypothetical protein